MSDLLTNTIEFLSGGTVVLFADIVIKATVLLLLVIVANALLWRRSAAVRHRLWSLAFCGLLGLPLLATLLPSWRLPILPPAADAAIAEAEPPTDTLPPALDPRKNRLDEVSEAELQFESAPTELFVESGDAAFMPSQNSLMEFGGNLATDDVGVVPADDTEALAVASVAEEEPVADLRFSGFVVSSLWGLGFMIAAWPLAIGFIRNAALQNAADAVDEDVSQSTHVRELSLSLGLRRRVQLMETCRSIVPITWGILRPIVLFPVAWREWTTERRELVLLHELAHVKRLDVAWQLVARLVCALYWFHPLAWYALRRLRIERELACDDCVLMTGARPSEYARELVDMATSYQFLVLPTTVAMAHTTNLEQRVMSLLDRARSHVPVGRIAGQLLLAVAVLVVTCVAVVRPSAKASNAIIVSQNDELDAAAKVPADNEKGDAFPIANGAVAADMTLNYKGRVVDENGKPIPGANLFFVYWSRTEFRKTDSKAAGTTDNDGQFEISSRRSDFSFDDEQAFFVCQIVAVADGFGLTTGSSIAFETTGLAAKYSDEEVSAEAKRTNPKRELQLVVDDVPLMGRVVSTEGQPVKGVRVRPDRTWFNKTGSLDSWEAATKAEKADFYSLRNETPKGHSGTVLSAAIPDVYTDEDGRFVVKGIGRERVVQLLIGGAGVETKIVKARTRAGKTIEVPNSWQMGDRPDNREIYHAAEFTHVAGPSKPVVGRITDADSGEPISSVLIAAGVSTTFTRSGTPWINTTTDADGKYRLEGLPVGDRETIYIQPQSTTAYLPAGASLQTKTDEAQIEKSFRLKKGIWVRGKTVDDRTDKPLSGAVQYFADRGNELLDDYPQFRGAGFYERRSDSEGRFAIAVPAGRGVLTFIPDDHGSYQRGTGAAGITVPGRMLGSDVKMFETLPHMLTSQNSAFYLEVTPSVGSAPIEVTLAPKSGETVTGKLIDPMGKPITDGRVVMTDDSLQPMYYSDQRNEFSVEGYYPQQPRKLFFFHVERNLAGYLKLEGKAPRDLTVTLRLAAAIRGRLVDDSGAPIPGVRLRGEGIPGQTNGIAELRLETDDDGRFLIRGLVPGYAYNVNGSGNGTFGQILIDTSVEKAGIHDVGDVKLKPEETSTASAVDSTSPTLPTGQRAELLGQISGPTGEAQEDATVWVAQQEVPNERWTSEWRPTKWKRIAQSAKDGSFNTALSLKPGSTIRLAATAPGFGWVWKDVQSADFNDEINFKLVKDLPIEGRILSLDGKPAVGVKLTVNHMTEKSPDSTLDEIIRATVGSSGVYTNCPSPPLNGGGPGFISVTTDADGRFRIEGMGADRSVRLEAIGGGIGASRFRILTRATPEKLKPHGAVDVREGLPESTYFATFTHIATPARTLRGTVTDKTTGEPIAGVRISSQSSWHIMLNPVTTDANGLYEITGLPKMEKYRPLIFEPPGTKHFNKENEIADSPGLEPITLDVALATGISVKGTLTDRESGRPLSGTLMYSPLAGNENWRTIGDPDVANPAATSVIGDDGTYEISVLPGPGGLTARTSASGYVPPTIDTKRLRELSTDITENVRGGITALTTQAGEQSHGFVGMFDKHALALINPSSDTTQLTVDLTAIQGRSVEGTILDDKGQPLAGVEASGLVSEVEPEMALETADFTVKDLAAGQKRFLYFYHAERKLGAAVVVDGQPTKPLTVQLRPTGSIKLRFVDRLGQPLPDIEVEAVGRWGTWNHTDADGRIEISNIIASTEYWIRAKPATQRGPSLFVTKATVEPGKSLDVGTFTNKNKYQYKLVDESAAQGE